MVRYMKCPRCELNYIDTEKQNYCDICLKEMKGISLDIDEMDDTEDMVTELCPVCNENMMRAGEKMCEECRKKADFDEEPDPDEDDEWREYLDDDTDSELDDELGESLKEEFSDSELEEEEEEEYESEEEEDLEYVTGDEIYMIPDDDEDDEEGDSDDF